MYVSQEVLNRLDELVRADFQNLRDLYFDWLLIATAAVFFGVVLEGPEVAHDLYEGFLRWKGLEIADFHHPLWVLILSSFGWLLITGGVIGEGIFDANVSWADGLLQRFNDILLASANERASRADERSEELRRDNLVLQTELLNLRIALANGTIPRSLEDKAQERIAEKLFGFSGIVVVTYERWTFDGLSLGQQVVRALDKAKIETVGRQALPDEGFGGPFLDPQPSKEFVGVQVMHTSDSRSKSFAYKLAKALRDERIKEVHVILGLKLLKYDDPLRSQVTIRIGGKPP